jgi:hypothetical protein
VTNGHTGIWKVFRQDRGTCFIEMFSVIGAAGNNNLTQYHYAVDVLKEITRKNDVS